MADTLKKISKAHTSYKTSDGLRVPGTTTITGLLAKPFLITWANRLGLEGIDSTKYRDEAADIGTLAHAMVQAHLQGEKLDLAEYTSLQTDLASNAVLSYYEWEKSHKIKPIMCEVPLVSDKYQFGGTIDCYCMLDGEYTLLDFKTGKAIYDEYFVQLAAYKELLIEKGFPISKCRILRIGRDETEGFEERAITATDKYFKIFENLLSIYKLKKELKWS